MKKFTDESMSEESRKMLKLLVNGGVIGDANIQEEKLREFRQKKLKNAYHNTELLMKNYRNIAWLLECFPDFIAAELDEPFEDIDKLINRLDVYCARNGRRHRYYWRCCVLHSQKEEEILRLRKPGKRKCTKIVK